jgi:hypothetical protein
MRVRHLATQHPRSTRCPLQRYFVRRLRFSGELMVSYFNLMIATDLCFAITPVGPRRSTTTLWPRGPPGHWLVVGPYAILMIVIAPWIRAYQGENYFGITGALTPCCRRAPTCRPPPGRVDRGSIGSNKAQQAAAPRDEVAYAVDHSSGSSGCKRPWDRLRYRDDGLPPSTIAARCASTVSRIVGWKNLRAAENAL